MPFYNRFLSLKTSETELVAEYLKQTATLNVKSY